MEGWDPHRPNLATFMETDVGVLQAVWGSFYYLKCIAEGRFLQWGEV